MSHVTATDPQGTVTVTSQALGEIQVPADAAVLFVDPMAGFPRSLRYALIPHTRPDGSEDPAVAWLQALDAPYHAFVVTDPWGIIPEYSPEISDGDAEDLGLASFQDARVFGILTIPGGAKEITINLRAPIVVNVARRVAKQVVLLNDEYHTRHR
ncbi:MAG: flagellar assembly protein FliW, partial [Actinomycetota bacterium]